jgi:hypothetical protein
MSIGAVRQGVTDPRALRTLMQRGVAGLQPTVIARKVRHRRPDADCEFSERIPELK